MEAGSSDKDMEEEDDKKLPAVDRDTKEDDGKDDGSEESVTGEEDDETETEASAEDDKKKAAPTAARSPRGDKPPVSLEDLFANREQLIKEFIRTHREFQPKFLKREIQEYEECYICHHW